MSVNDRSRMLSGVEDTPIQAEHADAFFAASARAFPNVILTQTAAPFRNFIHHKTIAGNFIARVRTSGLTAEASSRRAVEAGLAGWIKFVWQIEGITDYEDAQGSFRLRTGDTVLLPMSANYRFEMNPGCHGLMMMFDPAVWPEWLEVARSNLGRVIAPCASVIAAGACVASMLRHATGASTDRLAIQSALDLAFRAISEDSGSRVTPLEPWPARLRRAARYVERNLSNGEYSPADLARDLAVSRRTLYDEFQRAGLSPAKFIRRARLDLARCKILQTQTARRLSLTQIALDTGFADSSSFSHAFKSEFGVTPSSLR
jgi:AraC-like DNA-binding protein